MYNVGPRDSIPTLQNSVEFAQSTWKRNFHSSSRFSLPSKAEICSTKRQAVFFFQLFDFLSESPAFSAFSTFDLISNTRYTRTCTIADTHARFFSSHTGGESHLSREHTLAKFIRLHGLLNHDPLPDLAPLSRSTTCTHVLARNHHYHYLYHHHHRHHRHRRRFLSPSSASLIGYPCPAARPAPVAVAARTAVHILFSKLAALTICSDVM